MYVRCCTVHTVRTRRLQIIVGITFLLCEKNGDVSLNEGNLPVVVATVL